MLTCALRPAGLIGENDRGGSCYAFLQQASVAPVWQLHINLGNGNNLFDFTYISNVSYALLLAAEGLIATYDRIAAGNSAPLDHEKIDGEAFFVTNDEPAYFWDVVQAHRAAYGREIDIASRVNIPNRLAFAIGAIAETYGNVTGRQTKMSRTTVGYTCRPRYFNISKVKMRCGYKPLVSLDDGIKRAAKVFVENEQKEQIANDHEKKAQ